MDRLRNVSSNRGQAESDSESLKEEGEVTAICRFRAIVPARTIAPKVQPSELSSTVQVCQQGHWIPFNQ